MTRRLESEEDSLAILTVISQSPELEQLLAARYATTFHRAWREERALARQLSGLLAEAVPILSDIL